MSGIEPAGGSVEVLVPSTNLNRRVSELGLELGALLDESDHTPLLIGVLKGSTLFLADLVRALEVDVALDFMSISAYSAGAGQSGVVRIIKDLEHDIAGRDVVIVEDIVDTGLTLAYLRRALGERNPRSVRAVTLLDKSVRRIVQVELELRGFEVPDVYVVGYGLDFMGRYRNLPDLLAVRDIARLANDPDLLVTPLWGSQARPNQTGS
jgi:hypoxanthine phosphoribosyltransferase